MAPARTLQDLNVSRVITAAGPTVGATLQALSLWRRHGVVVFPSLLSAESVRALRGHAQALLLPVERGAVSTIDRTANIRAPAQRALRALPVSHEVTDALSQLSATVLWPFLEAALQAEQLLLLELGVMRASPGAAAQAWHRDDNVLDGRIVSVQIALVDTGAQQGALEVQPASHTHTEPTDEQAAPSVIVAVPEGTVTVYSPNVVHRGRANTHTEDRLTLVLSLVSESGLVPDGIPLAVQAEDAGRWWLARDGLQDSPHEAF